ncbi:ARM repeat-containing protein [Sparassis crispa]|uniref:ARM repeat-containing protein n=1 Tax=Sparassis crispa TaxID=139825 RepID=A0A401GBH7_9APHY|nr:ARM repeat-containing protein [Sparassis crispa]GBE79528.1 ARM repeat-containing protein [Sparassis crispa]
MRRAPVIRTTETLSPKELYDVVCAAASQDPVPVQQATTRLKELLELPGAFDVLHEIAAQKIVALQVRQQSIIQFKNAALSRWRSRRYLNDAQRIHIRTRCLSLLDEADETIAQCNEIIIAKIARHDFPSGWPTLISQLMGVINSNMESRYVRGEAGSELPLRRSLEILNAILKEFTSIKLPGGVKITGQLVEELRSVLLAHYSLISTSFPSSLNPSTIALPRSAEDLLFAHLVLKCVFREFFHYSATRLQALSELRINLVLALQAVPANEVARRSAELLARHVTLFGRFFQRIQRLSSSRFVTLPVCGDLVLYYWSKVVQAANGPQEYIRDSPDAVFPVRFLVQAMVLFKDSLAQWAPVRKDGTENDRVLSKSFVEDAVRLLVTRYIPLKPSDLEDWMADPEEWVRTEEQDNEQWIFELRACGERVLVSLANQYRQYVTPLLEATFKQVVGQYSIDLAGILQKEALYCAIGRCAPRLKEVIPFNEWLSRTLLAEARETNANYPILKRRIAWLIGKWISDMCSPANDPNIWTVLVHLLQDRGPGTDVVVRLTAAMALRECVDTIEFNENVFAPFLSTAVNELVLLMAEMDSVDSKRQVANSLNAVIERVGTRIIPLIPNVAEPIPQLWTAAEGDWLMKASLLVTSAKEHSQSLHVLVVALVRESFMPGAAVQLDEDAFVLWQSALRNATTIESVSGGPGLIDLFPLVVSLLSQNLDLLGSIGSIIESYYLLNAPRVLQLYAVDLFRAYVTAIGQAPPINIKDMITSLSVLFQVAPSSLWGEALHVSSLFALAIKALSDDKDSTTILTEYVYFFARIAMADKRVFLQLMSATAMAQNVPEPTLWEALLNQWWTRFDNMSEPRHRKLAAMGIADLVSTGRPEVLNRLSSDVCNLWMDVFGEIREAREIASIEDSSGLTLYWDRPLTTFYPQSEGTPEFARCKALYDNDPVRTAQLRTYVGARIQEAEMACGGGATFQSLYLEKADPLLLKQIQAELGKRP